MLVEPNSFLLGMALGSFMPMIMWVWIWSCLRLLNR